MKVLVIISNPARPSFRQRVGVLLDILFSNGVFAKVVKMPKTLLKRKKLFQLALEYDCVLLHKKTLNYLDSIRLRRYSKKIVYDFDDAVMYNAEEPERNEKKRLKSFQRVAGLSDMIIAGNHYLAEHAMKFNSNVHILPTGLDTKINGVNYQEKKDGKVRLVWIGSESTIRYLEDIKPALEEIGKQFDNVVLRIICDTFIDLEHMPVEKKLWSLESQMTDLLSGDIGLAPLRDNRFTRGKCGFKILQYAAAGLPVITSPVGINSEYVRDNVTGFHAVTIPEWIEKISVLVKDDKLRKNMGKAGKADVEKFDIEVIGRRLAELLLTYDSEKIKSNDVKSKTEKMKQIAPKTYSAKTVSICIPTYNRKEYLRETIQSILEQTYKDYEIVIVDDGSTDGTEAMVKSLGIPIKYYWQENKGDASARNKLIELAEGKYISFIDSDDLLMPDAIERLVSVSELHNGEAIVYGSYYRIGEDGRVYSKCKRGLYSGNITKQLFESISVYACGSIFPAKILRQSPAFDTALRVCSDYDLWLRLSTKFKFIALPEPTFKRRRHENNLSQASMANCLIEYEVIKRFYENGGDKFVPKSTAKIALSRKLCRAGRYAIKEGRYNNACALLEESFRKKTAIKSLVYLIKANLLRRFGFASNRTAGIASNETNITTNQQDRSR